MKRFGIAALFLLLPAASWAGPATRPAQQNEAAGELIHQLASDDYVVRERASQKLQAMGTAAHAALKEALKSSDPEVARRAEMILATQEEEAARKARDLVDPDRAGPDASSSTSVSVTNGAKTVEVREPNRQVRIVENADGIQMDVTTVSGGRQVKQQFRAADARGLKRMAPKAHELYQRCANPDGIEVNVAGHGAAFGRIVGGDEGNMAALEKELKRMLQDKDLPPEIKGMLEKHMKQLHVLPPASQPAPARE